MNTLEKLLKIKLDKIYCINVEENDYKKGLSKQESKKLNLDIHFYTSKRNNENPTKGCMDSHLECIKDAKKNNYENVLILEDDFMFLEEKINNHLMINYMDIPKDFDILFLGYNLNYGYRYDINLMKVIGFTGAHSYILNKRTYEIILSSEKIFYKTDISKTFPVIGLETKYNLNVKAYDLFLSKMICQNRMKSYGIYPMISYQRPGYSDIEEKMVDYNKTIFEPSLRVFEKKYIKDFQTLYINLDRRTDRNQKFLKSSSYLFNNLKKVSAIDGQSYDFSKYKDLFDLSNINIKNDHYPTHQNKSGVLGCSLSHYLLWELISKQENIEDDTLFLILEDDIKYSNNFIKELNQTLEKIKNIKDMDVLFLGYTDYKKLDTDEIKDIFIKLSGDKRFHGGGTFSYFITKSGCKKFYDISNKYKIQQPIDWFMIDHYDKTNSYKLVQDIIFSDVYQVSKDTDVQVDKEELVFNKENNFISEGIKLEYNGNNFVLRNKQKNKNYTCGLPTDIKYKIYYIEKNINLYLFYLLIKEQNSILVTNVKTVFKLENTCVFPLNYFKNLVDSLDVETIYITNYKFFTDFQVKKHINYDFIYLNNEEKYNIGKFDFNDKVLFNNHMDLINTFIFSNMKNKNLFELTFDTQLKKYNIVPMFIMKNNIKKQIVCLDKYNVKESYKFYKQYFKTHDIVYFCERVKSVSKNVIVKKYDIVEMYKDILTSEIIYFDEQNENTKHFIK